MAKTIIKKYWYVFLILIVIAIVFQVIFQKDFDGYTSAVILNLKKLNSSYNLENNGSTIVNATLFKDNKITGSVILDPKTSHEIQEEDFKVIGEQYE